MTHLSISYNLIEDIYELNRIINPEILLFLNVKGNFFCKNPSTNEVILNLFLNLKSLDDLKINNSHKKLIKYGEELNRLILPFLLDIEEKNDKISTIQNVFQLNQEYNLVNSSSNSLQNNNNENLNALIEELNNIDENSVAQILSLINEKKVLNNNNNVMPPINELNKLINIYLNNSIHNNLLSSEGNKIKDIYEKLFFNLILSQKRKDYKGFLNYLIMSSEPKLLEFIKSKGNYLSNIEMNKTSINIICQNFEKILMNNSNYSLQNINEIQMMIFYMYFNGNNILTNNENDVEIFTDEKGKEKIILNNYEKKLFNFREIIPDYFPIFPLDSEFMKNLMNFIKEKINLFLKNISEINKMRNNQKINLNKDEKNIIANNIQNNEIEQSNFESNQNINHNEQNIIEEDDNLNKDINNENNLNNLKDINCEKNKDVQQGQIIGNNNYTLNVG